MTQHPTSPSLHDVDSEQAAAARASAGPGRGRRAALALTGLALVGGLGLGASQLPLGGDSALTVPAPVAGADGTHRGGQLTVVVDGWSVASMGGGSLAYRTSTGQAQELTLRPATQADLDALREGAAPVLRDVLARMVTSAPGLSCSASACTSDEGLLLQPGDIPALGASYTGYGITSGLWVGRVPVRAGDVSVQLSGDGLAPIDLPVAPPRTSADGAPMPAEAGNGYLTGRFAVGAGLGRLFTLQPAWIGSGKDVQRYLPAAALPVSGDPVAALQRVGVSVTATSGLSSPFAGARSWDASHLTYATSPTTGCGAEALCVPKTLSPRVVRETREVARVCSPAGQRAGLAMEDLLLEVDYPAPTHQFGVSAGEGRWGGTPALVRGKQRVHVSAAGLFDGDPLQLRASAGRVGTDDGAAMGTQELLAKVSFAGERYTACP